VVLIAHRLSTAALADTIVVMEQGKAVQSGTHAQLAAEDGLYRQLLEAGMAGMDECLEVQS